MQAELIADCVHCGFCLPTCPTYTLWHEEMDSPRGRIHLMSALVDGTLPLTDTVVEHFDRCLGCMACVPACPSGVQYDRLIETTRAHIERGASAQPQRAPAPRLIFAVFPHRRRLRAALAFRRLPAPGPFRAARRARAAVARPGVAAGAPARPRAAGGARRRAACRASSSATSTPRPRACSRPTATTCTSRARRVAAARCTRMPGGSTRASSAHVRSSGSSPATTTSSRTRPAAARI